MEKGPYKTLGEHIKAGTESISHLVNSLSSFKKVANTVFLLASGAIIGLGSLYFYREIESKHKTITRELLASSMDGHCLSYLWNSSTLTIEYRLGYNPSIQANTSIIAEIGNVPADKNNFDAICQYLKSK